MLIPLTVAMVDTPPEARWLTERSLVAGYIVVIVLNSFGGQGEMWSYDFACPPEPRGGSTLSVVAHSISYRGGGERGVGANCEKV